MKALSIKQPWAWAIFHGKPVENRNWYSKHRGPLLIHASKTFDYDGYLWILENSQRLFEFPIEFIIPGTKKFQFGGIVGKVNMVDCVKSYDSAWFFGEYGFVFEAPEILQFKRCRGMPGMFEVDYE